MRYLELGNAQHYDVLYNGILNAGPLDKYQIRLVAKVLEKLEAVGEQKDSGYELKEPVTVAVEEPEYKLLESIVDGIKWNPRFAKESISFMDWFSNAPTKPTLRVEDAGNAQEAAT